MVLAPCWKSVSLHTQLHFRTLSSIPLSCASLLVPHWLFTIALWCVLRKGSVDPSLFSFSRLFLAIIGPLQLCMNFRINSSVSPEKSTGIWQGLHRVYSSGDFTILTTLSLPFHEHGILFHLFITLISLTMFCSFQSVSFAFVVTFTPKCFTLFDALVIEIAFWPDVCF